MMRYFDKKMGLLLILFMHIFLNIDFYCDIYSKLWSQKINFEVVSPKGRYMVEYYSLNQFVNLLTKHTRYSGYSRVYDNKKNAYVYESSVYDLIAGFYLFRIKCDQLFLVCVLRHLDLSWRNNATTNRKEAGKNSEYAVF